MTSSDEEDRAQKRMRLEQLQVVREVALDFAAASSFHSRRYIQPEQIEFIENCVPAQDQMAGAQLTRNAPQQLALRNLEEREISSQSEEAKTEKIFEQWHVLLDGLKKSLDRWTRIYKPEPAGSKGTGATAKCQESKSSMSSFTILPSMTPAQLRKCVQQLGPKAISQLGYINAVLQELLVSMKSTQRRLIKAIGQCNSHLDGHRQTGDKEAPLPPPPAVRQSGSNKHSETRARDEQNQHKTVDENRPVTNASNGAKERETRLPTPRQKAKTRPIKWATIAELLEQQKESDAQAPSAECNAEKLTPRKRRRQDHRMEAQLKNLVSILHAWRTQK